MGGGGQQKPSTLLTIQETMSFGSTTYHHYQSITSLRSPSFHWWQFELSVFLPFCHELTWPFLVSATVFVVAYASFGLFSSVVSSSISFMY